jgi:DNA-binding transcriptional regulator/RsmH inhibitor MraZ
MSDDQARDLLLKLARALEHFFLESNVRQLALETHGRPGWKKLEQQMLADEKMKAQVRSIFQPLYENIEHATEDQAISDAIEKLLRTPVKGKPN